MTREERIQKQLADAKRGLDSITIDAFRTAKEILGVKYHHLSPEFRKQYKYWLGYCRYYYMKDKNGARYRMVNAFDMFDQLKQQSRGL